MQIVETSKTWRFFRGFTYPHDRLPKYERTVNNEKSSDLSVAWLLRFVSTSVELMARLVEREFTERMKRGPERRTASFRSGTTGNRFTQRKPTDDGACQIRKKAKAERKTSTASARGLGEA